jgi:histidine phosphotransferase ChpT
MARNEILSVLEDAGRADKVKIAWRPAAGVERLEAKLAFLLIQCFESAMPFGGTVEVRADRGRWRLVGVADKLRIREEVWGVLAEAAGTATVTPAQVHFALAPVVAGRLGRRLDVSLADGRIEVAF